MEITHPQKFHEKLLEDAVPELRYTGGDYKQWQSTARSRLRTLLGLPQRAAGNSIQIAYQKTGEDYTETRLVFESEPGFFAPMHVLIPTRGTPPYETVFCLQGHSMGAHISLGRPKYERDAESIAGDRDFAVQAVRKGYAAIVTEQRGFGELGGTDKGPDCHQSSVSAILFGRTLLGERVFDVSRAIDVATEHFPEIDPGRIGIMGNSGGGTVTIYAAAADERIYKAMPSCSFCGYGESIGKIHHCICNYIPGIIKYFDMSDLVGLIAPRPVVIVNGLEDGIFPVESVRREYRHVQALYAAAGAPERCALVVGAGGHRFYAKEAWPVYQGFSSEPQA